MLRRDGTPMEHPFFAIVARDPAAKAALLAYADEAERLGYDPAFVSDVRQLAIDYEAYRVEKAGSGDPDAPRHRKDDPVVIAWARSIHGQGA